MKVPFRTAPALFPKAEPSFSLNCFAEVLRGKGDGQKEMYLFMKRFLRKYLLFYKKMWNIQQVSFTVIYIK